VGVQSKGQAFKGPSGREDASPYTHFRQAHQRGRAAEKRVRLREVAEKTEAYRQTDEFFIKQEKQLRSKQKMTLAALLKRI
jgi:hypothetical protein